MFLILGDATINIMSHCRYHILHPSQRAECMQTMLGEQLLHPATGLYTVPSQSACACWSRHAHYCCSMHAPDGMVPGTSTMTVKMI